MARGFLSAMVQVSREAERQRRAAQRHAERDARYAIRMAKENVRIQRHASKEAERQFHEGQAAEAARLTELVQSRVQALDGLLSQSLRHNPSIDLRTLRRAPAPRPEAKRAPVLESFLPAKPGFFRSLMPGAKARHQEEVRSAHDHFVQTMAEHLHGTQQRELEWEATNLEADQYNVALEKFAGDVAVGVPEAVSTYFTLVLEHAVFFSDQVPQANVGYLKDSKQLVVDYYLPEVSVVPEEASFNYVKAKQKIQIKTASPRERKARYASSLAQLALAALSTIFRAGYDSIVETVVLNGMVETTDPATGHDIKPCLFSVRATRDAFASISLARVLPIDCLKALKASVSVSPDELVPVRPILELKMTDPRFIATEDLLSAIDDRTNLMDLSPTEFEELITNLFAKMGLETRLTQASRDGGVDCVAYDQRPILGGKVIIQAKRYKNTVGVSAVRDLYGTMHNEGASKGILVTTSGYGKAAFDFAAGKPLELLDGSNLLYLLEERAGIRCKIVMPEGDAPSSL
jgi:restriction system protein